MSTNRNNPFSRDASAVRLGRPGRHIPQYATLSDDALAIAQEWFDQAETDRKAAAERKARFESSATSPEAEQARARMARQF